LAVANLLLLHNNIFAFMNLGSDSAKNKKKMHRTTGGLTVHSFDTLLDNISYVVRDYCKFQIGDQSVVYVKHTVPDNLQAKAFDLLGIVYPVN